MLTCYSDQSRNRRVGVGLGQNKTLTQVTELLGGEIAEGVPTAKAAARLAAKYGIETPIINALDLLLDGKLTPQQLVTNLMSLPLRPED